MGKILEELVEKSNKLQKELDVVNQEIIKYQNDPYLEITDYENRINVAKRDAISEFMNLLKHNESSELEDESQNKSSELENESDLDKLEKLLEKYMISHEYNEVEGPEGYRPAQIHSYVFNLKDFELKISIELVRYHDDIESSIQIYLKNDSEHQHIFNKYKKSFYDTLAKKYKNILSEEEISDYSTIFSAIDSADLEDFDRFF